jgi:DnaJ-class molecular chaperone
MQNLKEDWSKENCYYCNGSGQICDYGFGEDFYDIKECKKCNGTGIIYKTPKGRHVEYPGGRFV